MLGAHEVGMLAALADAGIRPDLVVGTSIGAINGVFVAADPVESARRLESVWRSDEVRTVFRSSLFGQLGTAGPVRHPCALERAVATAARAAPAGAAVRRAAGAVPVRRGQRGAGRARPGSISGPLIPAVLASAAVPGLLPPVRINGEHHFDGGLVHSIPVGRAVQLGARRVFVLHVGRIEQPLAVPRRPWEVGLVAFEIARRHRFVEEMATLPDDVIVHVLPAGSNGPVPI